MTAGKECSAAPSSLTERFTMKTVFTNSMCAHVWAQQSQASGRSNSMSFEGDTLFSYGTPIARILKSRRGRVLLLTSRAYSNTTAGHRSQAWRAFKGETFQVASLGVSGGRHREPDGTWTMRGKPNHKANLAELVRNYTATIQRLKRMRNEPYGPVAATLKNAARQAISYAAAFGFKNRLDAGSIAADVGAVEAYRTVKAANRTKRERQPAQAWKAALREQANRIREGLRIERARIARLEAAGRIALWRAGNPDVWLGWDAQRTNDGSAMLRLKPTYVNIVQTSQGAEVPADAARALLTIVRDVRNGVPFYPKGARIGDFAVDNISSGGDVRAGCHFISWSEIEAFSNRVGW